MDQFAHGYVVFSYSFLSFLVIGFIMQTVKAYKLKNKALQQQKIDQINTCLLRIQNNTKTLNFLYQNGIFYVFNQQNREFLGQNENIQLLCQELSSKYLIAGVYSENEETYQKITEAADALYS
jgi:hypothetical protein